MSTDHCIKKLKTKGWGYYGDLVARPRYPVAFGSFVDPGERNEGDTKGILYMIVVRRRGCGQLHRGALSYLIKFTFSDRFKSID